MNTEKIMEDIQSVQDNIREIKSTWGNTIMTLDNIKSGLKADVQKKVDEAYQRGHDDGYEAGCATAFKPVSDAEYQRGYDEGYKKCLSENDFDQPCISCEGYQRGLEDAWEAAQKVVCKTTEGGMSLDTLKEIFGVQSPVAIMQSNTAQQAIDKIKTYEDKHSDRIEVGDEVIAPCGKAVVTLIETDDLVHYLYSGGDYGCIEPQKLKKTGRHFDIQSILEAMRE